VLDALQDLARLAVQSETGEMSRLMLDIAEFRAGRKERLAESAREAIAKVKESGDQFASPNLRFSSRHATAGT
jgi:spoIIIJ-associated protein